MNPDFKVRVGEFEGPLTLLLDLIEKRKLHISDVSLSAVADEFIEHIKSFEEFPIADSADFILIASTLLLIKSKSLLPNLSLTTEEQGSIKDLENILITYRKYKELSINIERMFGNFLYFAKERKEINVVFAPTPDITLLSLKRALREALQNIHQQIEDLPKMVVQKIMSLEEMVDKLKDRVQTSLKTSFSDFAHVGKAEKVNVIVSFLAMLEIVKLSKLAEREEGEVREALKNLANSLGGRGICLIETDTEVSLATSKEARDFILKMAKDEMSREIGKAGLETLSIILYNGPVTRREVDYIRGVNSTFILRNLCVRGLIERELDPKDQRLFRYKGSLSLLAHLGLKKVEELPEFEMLKNKIEGSDHE